MCWDTFVRLASDGLFSTWSKRQPQRCSYANMWIWRFAQHSDWNIPIERSDEKENLLLLTIEISWKVYDICIHMSTHRFWNDKCKCFPSLIQCPISSLIRFAGWCPGTQTAGKFELASMVRPPFAFVQLHLDGFGNLVQLGFSIATCNTLQFLRSMYINLGPVARSIRPSNHFSWRIPIAFGGFWK